MGLRQAAIDFERFRDCRPRSCGRFAGRGKAIPAQHAVHSKHAVDLGQPYVGLRILGIFVDGLLIIDQCFFEALFGPSVPMKTALQVGFISYCVHGRRRWAGKQFHGERPADAVRNVGLDGQDISQRPVVTLGPQMNLIGSADELGGDAHSFASAAHRAFQQKIHAQLARDFMDALVRSFVLYG